MPYPSKKPFLRYAIAFTGETVPAWATHCVSALSKLNGSTDAIWIHLEKSGQQLKAIHLKRSRALSSTALSFELIEGGDLSHQSITEQLRALNVHFILFLAAGEIGPEWLNLAKEGLWFFRFGEESETGADFGTREFSAGGNTQVVTLEQTLQSTGSRTTLRQGRFKIKLHSLAAHRASILAQCSEWPARLAQELLDTGHLSVQTPQLAHDYLPVLNRFVSPLFSLIPIALVQTYRFTQEFFKRLRRLFTYQQWNIGLLRGPIDGLFHSPLEIDWLPAPRWPLSYADPFPIEIEGRRYIVAEQYDFRTDCGSIVVFPLNDTGKVSAPPFTAFDFPFHVSYPCLVKDGNILYCVAETLETKGIAIYQCEKFPRIWTKVADVASDQSFADPTVFFDEGRWWLFSTLFDKSSGGNASLYAWHAERIRGPWTPHLKNPVKCDVGSSRSAGNPFRVGGELFRPAQDCSERYGFRVVINKITVLSPTDFCEELVCALGPHPTYPDGFHHIASFGDTILVDGRRDLFYPPAAVVKLKRLFKRWAHKPGPEPFNEPGPLRPALRNLNGTGTPFKNEGTKRI